LDLIVFAARWDIPWVRRSEDFRKQFPVQSQVCRRVQLTPSRACPLACHLDHLVTLPRFRRLRQAHRQVHHLKGTAAAVIRTEKVRNWPLNIHLMDF
jgi:hypothetical protein